VRGPEVGSGEVSPDFRERYFYSVGPLAVLESNDSDIVKIFTGSEIVIFNRHDGLPISFRVIGRATKRILQAVHG
jgi:hypothetical protein